jgi:hypothetical protein
LEPPCPLVVTAAAAGLLSSPAASPPPRPPAADSNRDEGSGRVVVVSDAPGRSAPPRAGSEPARRRYANKVGGGVALREAWLLDEEAGL